MKNFLQNKAIRPYLITYCIWLSFLLLFILNSTTEYGTPYPVLPGIFVSAVSAFVFSAPIWVVQFMYIRHRAANTKEKAKGQRDPTVTSSSSQPAGRKEPAAPSADSPSADGCPVSDSAPHTQRQVQAERAHRMQENRIRRAAAQKRIEENLARQKEEEEAAAVYRENRIQATQAMDDQQLLIDAIRFSVSKMFVSEEMLKTEYPGLSEEKLQKMLTVLHQLGVLQKRPGTNTWLSLLDCEDAQILFDSLTQRAFKDGIDVTVPNEMDSHQFEQHCVDLLRKNGLENVEVTKASGDFGIDVLAEKDGITYAIQCKYYTDKVGNHAVQEAFAGKEYYDRMVAVVMTNSTFTPAAIETAEQTHVLLWDGSKLAELASV